MIRKLRIKFIVIIMSITTITFLCVFGAVNLTMYKSTERQTLEMMNRVAVSDGMMRLEDKPPKPTKGRKDYIPGPVPQSNFSVKLDDIGNITEITSDRNQLYTETEVKEYLKKALSSGKLHGSIADFKFLIHEKPYGKIVVFFDNSIQASVTTRLFLISLIVGISGVIGIFLLSLYLSSWAIRPVKEAYEAQKRFVADASHELKTPLTIISANADVLSSDLGQNKWIEFIKMETLRMGELVNNLLYLAKSDASEHTYHMQEFDLSSAVTNAVLPFESACYESQKHLVLEIKEQITCRGDESRLMQVVMILMDNAIKNSNQRGEIKISLKQQHGKKMISVYNTGEGISEEDKKKIFDRFYRGDNSRARQTGGYGLGLSIAKSIIDAHKGKILIESEKDMWAKFTIVL